MKIRTESVLKTGFAFMLLFMYGCASIVKAPENENIEAKKFRPNPDVAQVYLYRNETFGAAVSMPVYVNGKLAGNTGPKSFFKFDLPAGTHTITSQETSTLNLDAEKGKTYFIWQEVKMGAVKGGSVLQLVDEKKGKKGVMQCTLIKSNL